MNHTAVRDVYLPGELLAVGILHVVVHIHLCNVARSFQDDIVHFFHLDRIRIGKYYVCNGIADYRAVVVPGLQRGVIRSLRCEITHNLELILSGLYALQQAQSAAFVVDVLVKLHVDHVHILVRDGERNGEAVVHVELVVPGVGGGNDGIVVDARVNFLDCAYGGEVAAVVKGAHCNVVVLAEAKVTDYAAHVIPYASVAGEETACDDAAAGFCRIAGQELGLVFRGQDADAVGGVPVLVGRNGGGDKDVVGDHVVHSEIGNC